MITNGHGHVLFESNGIFCRITAPGVFLLASLKRAPSKCCKSLQALSRRYAIILRLRKMVRSDRALSCYSAEKRLRMKK